MALDIFRATKTMIKNEAERTLRVKRLSEEGRDDDLARTSAAGSGSAWSGRPL